LRVVITGADGFIGKNLKLHLRELGDAQVASVTRDTTHDELASIVASADFVFHLAGVNRPSDPADPNKYVCGVKGTKIGGKVGVGFHSFFGQTVALGVELSDVIAQLNPAGRDVNGDLIADNNDLSWTNTFLLTANLTVFFPSAKVSP